MLTIIDAGRKYSIPVARLFAAVRLGLLHAQTSPVGLVMINEEELLQLLGRSEKR